MARVGPTRRSSCAGSSAPARDAYMTREPESAAPTALEIARPDTCPGLLRARGAASRWRSRPRMPPPGDATGTASPTRLARRRSLPQGDEETLASTKASPSHCTGRGRSPNAATPIATATTGPNELVMPTSHVWRDLEPHREGDEPADVEQPGGHDEAEDPAIRRSRRLHRRAATGAGAGRRPGTACRGAGRRRDRTGRRRRRAVPKITHTVPAFAIRATTRIGSQPAARIGPERMMVTPREGDEGQQRIGDTRPHRARPPEATVEGDRREDDAGRRDHHPQHLHAARGARRGAGSTTPP